MHTAKQERLEARISASQKKLFQKAASLEGRTLTDFIISAVKEVALRILQERQVIRLTAKDQESFVKALLNPPEPHRRLKAASERYRQNTDT